QDRDPSLGDDPESVVKQVDDARALGAIDRGDRGEEGRRFREPASQLLDRGEIFRKTGPAEAKARSQVTGADARVERERPGKTLAIRADGFTDTRQHVRERDLRCEKGVR